MENDTQRKDRAPVENATLSTSSSSDYSRPVALVQSKASPVSATHRVTIDTLAGWFKLPTVGTKDGPAWVPADIEKGPRKAERVKSLSFLVLDVEADADPVKDENGDPVKDKHGDIVKRITGPLPPAPAELLAELDLHGWRALMHTSYSHAVGNPRYRLALDLSRPLLPSELKGLGLHVAATLGISDCFDSACLDAARLFYLPRCPADRVDLYVFGSSDGESLDVDSLLSDAQRIEAARKAATNKRTAGRTGSVIQAFNAAHDIATLLERHGYTRKGRRRWIWADSTTGVPGVRLLPDSTPERIYSSHGGDPLNDGHAHDAFDCWRLLEHGGDVQRAVKEAARLLGMDTQQQPKAKATGAGERLANALHDEAITLAKDYAKSCAGTWWVKHFQDDDEYVFLANFTAEIVAETTLDDGAERRRRLEITGAINGRPLPTATVASGDFAALGWVGEQFGSAAHIAPGHSIKDRLRYAIQVLSTATQYRTVYQHTGWREIDGQWLYLTPTAAIGAAGAVEGIDVDLPGTLSDYALLPTAGGAADAARASLGMLDCAPASIAVPLFLAPYRAMLSEALPGDFSLFMSGVTGSRKTEMAAIVQAHFGDAWHGKRLPAAWSSTANSLERAAFLAKDAVMVVDDFCPTGTTTDIARFHTGADRLLRAQGNRAGRQRMNPDGTLRPAYYPRGLIVATGEDIPRGQSLRGRLLILEFDSHTVDLSALSAMQDHAATGRLAESAGAFAQWLAPRMGELKKSLPAMRNQLRSEITATAHSRHPDTLAGLVLTAQLFAQFATEHGVVLSADWETNITQALLQAGADQQQAVASEEPAGRFVRLIHSALSAGLCHVRQKNGIDPSISEDMTAFGWQLRHFGGGDFAHDEQVPQGPCIGWFDDGGLYLDPDAAYRTATRYASDQGQALPLTPRALFKALDNKGRLVTKNTGRTTVKCRIGDGATKNVLHLHPMPMRNCGNNGNSGNNGTKAADSYEEYVFPQTGTGTGTTGTTGTGTGTDPVGGDAENDACSRFVPAVPAMFPQAFCEREQKNARNTMINNDISQPVPVVPVVPANAHIPPHKLLVASIMTAVSASPAGIVREDLERTVARSHPKAGALIRASVDRLLLAGDIAPTNGRIVLARAATAKEGWC